MENNNWHSTPFAVRMCNDYLHRYWEEGVGSSSGEATIHSYTLLEEEVQLNLVGDPRSCIRIKYGDFAAWIDLQESEAMNDHDNGYKRGE